MIFYVLTLFPEMIKAALNHSILKRAAEDRLIEVCCLDIRGFAPGKRKQVDDAPYGGGAGMVMMPGPVFYACEYARGELGKDTRIICLTPQGVRYDQRKAEELSKLGGLILLCGHYEGIDQRAIDLTNAEEMSVGDFILTGGELAALAVIDSVSRLIPGVLGKAESFQHESFSDGLLEYPQYTRPPVFNGVEAPPELLSGHHKNIEIWRRRQSLVKTAKIRPDLLAGAALNKDELKYLQDIQFDTKRRMLMEESVVLKYFREISKIPRCSRNEKQISDWLCSFAKERRLDVIQDAFNNIIIKKPGTRGYENSGAIIIQGHMDMVCEKNAGTQHDFLNDPIRLIDEGDTVRADGTTLGADNGIAAAIALALLDATDIPHPPLEVLLTTDEESGMTGAAYLDASLLSGRKLINMDSEEEGVFYVSCAGGLRVVLNLPAEYTELPDAYDTFTLRVKGLKGGHSGMDADKNRGNSNKLMGRALHAIFSETDARLVRVSGGMKMNAIPRESEAVIAVKTEDYGKIAERVRSFEYTIRNEYHKSDPSVTLEFTRIEAHNRQAFSRETGKKVIAVLNLMPQGVMEMSQDIPGLPETSNNLGVVSTDEKAISFANALRSCVASRKYALKEQIEQLAALSGAECEMSGDYPGWEYDPNSALREALIKEYESIYGRKPEIKAVHAGLECGLFIEKIPGLDVISFGPDIFNAHSPGEYFSVPSVERVWDFLTRVLTKI